MNFIGPALTALLLVQGPAASQTSQQTRPEDRASLTGFVVKMGTGEPLSKAVVLLSPSGGGRNRSQSVTTTSSGQFVFQNIDPGQYRLVATRNGYVRMEFGARAPNRPGLPITLTPGQKMTQVVLQLMPAGTIAGRIYDRDGEPLANAIVQALKYSYREGERVMNSVQQARTNDLGEYRLFWLTPGQYYVSAVYNEPRGFGGPGGRRRFGGGGGGPAAASRTADTDDEGYIPVYYPGTFDAQSAAPINLPAGLVFNGVDLTVEAVRTLRVRGQIISGVTGQPVRNANVLLLPRERAGFAGGRGANFRTRNINEQGVFEIRDVVPGSYDLIAALNDRTNHLSARVPLEIGNSDVENVTLVLSPGFTVAGRLAIENNSSTDPDAISRMRVVLRSSQGIGLRGIGVVPAAVQADGTFMLRQVGQDAYRLVVTGIPRNGYIKTARLGSADVLNQGLRLDRPPEGPLEILISTNTGSMDATITDEKQKPSVNVTFVLVPDAAHRHRTDLYRTALSDAFGHIHIEGIPPGDYKAFAWEDVETGAWQDPEFIRLYEDRGKPVQIMEASQASVELRLIPSQM